MRVKGGAAWPTVRRCILGPGVQPRVSSVGPVCFDLQRGAYLGGEGRPKEARRGGLFWVNSRMNPNGASARDCRALGIARSRAKAGPTSKQNFGPHPRRAADRLVDGRLFD